MILNAEGPIGVFASSRESHPYPNALYGQAIVTELVNRRPATIGEGIAAVRAGMRKADIPFAALLTGLDTAALKREHEGLYNLLGDPATPLRYPDAVDVHVPIRTSPGASFDVDVKVPNGSGRVLVTLETRRRSMKETLVAPSSVPSLPRERAFSAMDDNYAKANDKIVAQVDGQVANGRATLRMAAPSDPGDYVVKALVLGASSTGAGHAQITVAR